MAPPAPSDARARHRETAHRAHVRGCDIWQDASNPLLTFWAEKTEEIEPELLDWIDRFPEGSVFYDLGTSVGAFAIYAAKKRKARVYAFEAEAQNFAIAERNYFLNADEIVHPVSIFNLAIAEDCRAERLFVQRYDPGTHNKIVGTPELRDTRQTFAPDHVQPVLTFPLDRLRDEFGLPQPQYVKIDIDGSEEAALRGGAAMFRAPSLREVFIEVHKPDDPEDGGRIVALMANYGFSVARKVPVAHMRGGTYPDLLNIVFTRS